MAVEIGSGSRVLVSVVGAGLKGDKGDDGGGLGTLALVMPEGFDVVGSPASGLSGSFTVTMADGYFLMTEEEKSKLAGLGDAPVTSVNGATGDVTLDAEDVGAEPERTLVSDPDAIAGTSTDVYSWSPAKVALAAQAAISGGMVIEPFVLTSAAPEGDFPGAKNSNGYRLELALYGSQYTYMVGPGEAEIANGIPGLDVRFSTNNGASYGAWSALIAPVTGAGSLSLPGAVSARLHIMLDLNTGRVIRLGEVTGTITVPSGVTNMQFRRVSSITEEYVAFVLTLA